MRVDIYNTNKKYNIIYADPPWKYWSGGNKGAEKHYKCMEKQEIYNMKDTIQKISNDNCILFFVGYFSLFDRRNTDYKRVGI